MFLPSLRVFRPALLALLLLGGAAHGHDAWIEPQPDGGLAFLYGHAEQPQGAAASRIASLAAIDAQGRPVLLRIATRDGAVRLEPVGAAAPVRVSATYDNGFWTRTTQGLKNLPMNEAPGALGGSHALLFTKTVMAWTPAALVPAGQALEIVPLAAPSAGAITVQVLADGRPLAAALVSSGEEGRRPPIATDAQGRVRVPVRAGPQLLTVSHRSPLAGDARADTLAATANLAFRVAP